MYKNPNGISLLDQYSWQREISLWYRSWVQLAFLLQGITLNLRLHAGTMLPIFINILLGVRPPAHVIS